MVKALKPRGQERHHCPGPLTCSSPPSGGSGLGLTRHGHPLGSAAAPSPGETSGDMTLFREGPPGAGQGGHYAYHVHSGHWQGACSALCRGKPGPRRQAAHRTRDGVTCDTKEPKQQKKAARLHQLHHLHQWNTLVPQTPLRAKGALGRKRDVQAQICPVVPIGITRTLTSPQ